MLPSGSTLLLPFVLIAALQVKHVICDGPLQTLQMVRDKSHYMRPLGVLHAAIHGAGSFVVMMAFGIDAATAALVSGAELLAHYHIDYCKENVVKRAGWSTTDGPFWWLLTFDQALHHFTYLAMAYVMFRT